MDKGNGNGNTVLLTVIGVATLLVALVGATFAYFTATVNVQSEQSVSVTTATPVGLKYVGAALTLTNAIPGDKAGDEGEITFTIENPETSTVSQRYDLNLIIDENEFTYTTGTDNAEQLVITMSAESDGQNTPVPTTTYNVTDGASAAAKNKTFVVVADQAIAPAETQTYTIQIEFKELNTAQDNNQGKNFHAHIEISDVISI